MRLALLTPLLAAGALFACSTFGGAEDAPKPSVETDAGQEAAPVPDTCEPVVFDPDGPSQCPGADLQSDPLNCGACGHLCVDTKCDAGICEREELFTGAKPILAALGTKVYVPEGSTIQRADVAQQRPLTFETILDNQTGTVNHLEVHAGELYIGWSNNQTILKLDEPPTPRPNDGYAAVNTDVVGGHYFPGTTSYYLFPDKTAGEQLARIAPNEPVAFKQQSSFLPIARSGDALYWLQKLGTGNTAKIVGPWDRADESLAIVDSKVEAFAAEGDTVFIASGGYLSRATRGATEVKRLASEEGVGVAFVTEDSQLFYAVRRTIGDQDRHFLFRIDKCKGGVPVPLLDINQAILGIYLNEPTHVLVNTTSGLFRMRR